MGGMFTAVVTYTPYIIHTLYYYFKKCTTTRRGCCFSLRTLCESEAGAKHMHINRIIIIGAAVVIVFVHRWTAIQLFTAYYT